MYTGGLGGNNSQQDNQDQHEARQDKTQEAETFKLKEEAQNKWKMTRNRQCGSIIKQEIQQ